MPPPPLLPRYAVSRRCVVSIVAHSTATQLTLAPSVRFLPRWVRWAEYQWWLPSQWCTTSLFSDQPTPSRPCQEPRLAVCCSFCSCGIGTDFQVWLNSTVIQLYRAENRKKKIFWKGLQPNKHVCSVSLFLAWNTKPVIVIVSTIRAVINIVKLQLKWFCLFVVSLFRCSLCNPFRGGKRAKSHKPTAEEQKRNTSDRLWNDLIKLKWLRGQTDGKIPTRRQKQVGQRRRRNDRAGVWRETVGRRPSCAVGCLLSETTCVWLFVLSLSVTLSTLWLKF